MTAFPRTIKPRRTTMPMMPGPLVSVGQSGKVTTRGSGTVGRTWSEEFWFDVSGTNGRAFVAQCQSYMHNGTSLTLAHQDMTTLLGAGGSLIKVKGSAQTGSGIVIDGLATSSTILKVGDLVTFANINTVYDVMADVITTAVASATMTINPPILSGGSPADNAVVTPTGTVVFTAIIESLDIEESGPNNFAKMTVHFRETP